jgi:hypothetical protein
MKRIYFFAPFLLIFGCGAPTETQQAKADSVVTPVVPDTAPHTVMSGKEATYAYVPDTCFNDLVLGSTTSFKQFWQANGADMHKLADDRAVATYFTSSKSEWMSVYITKDSKNHEVAYGLVLQKAGQKGAPPMPPGRAYTLSKPNVLTGHSIYIGMSPTYVMSIYRDQPLTQWERGDTLYLKYKPSAKDAGNFKRYSYAAYSATYKFVEDRLRRIEYMVDPAELEKR